MQIEYWVSTNKVGSKCLETLEVDAQEWASISEEEKDKIIFDQVLEGVDWGYQEL